MITITFLHCDTMKITDELNSVVSWNPEVLGCGHCDTTEIIDELNSVVSWNQEVLGCGHCDTTKITDELNSVVSWNPEALGCEHCDTTQITDELNSVVSWNPEALGVTVTVFVLAGICWPQGLMGETWFCILGAACSQQGTVTTGPTLF